MLLQQLLLLYRHLPFHWHLPPSSAALLRQACRCSSKAHLPDAGGEALGKEVAVVGGSIAHQVGEPAGYLGCRVALSANTIINNIWGAG